MKYFCTFQSMKYFRMELDQIEISLCILSCRNRTVSGISNGSKSGSHLGNIIIMTHPDLCNLRIFIGKHRTCHVIVFQIFSAGLFFISDGTAKCLIAIQIKSHTIKKCSLCIYKCSGLSVFAVIRSFNFSSQNIGHQLCSVAKAKYRTSDIK